MCCKKVEHSFLQVLMGFFCCCCCCFVALQFCVLTLSKCTQHIKGKQSTKNVLNLQQTPPKLVVAMKSNSIKSSNSTLCLLCSFSFEIFSFSFLKHLYFQMVVVVVIHLHVVVVVVVVNCLLSLV